MRNQPPYNIHLHEFTLLYALCKQVYYTQYTFSSHIISISYSLAPFFLLFFYNRVDSKLDCQILFADTCACACASPCVHLRLLKAVVKLVCVDSAPGPALYKYECTRKLPVCHLFFEQILCTSFARLICIISGFFRMGKNHRECRYNSRITLF